MSNAMIHGVAAQQNEVPRSCPEWFRAFDFGGRLGNMSASLPVALAAAWNGWVGRSDDGGTGDAWFLRRSSRRRPGGFLACFACDSPG